MKRESGFSLAVASQPFFLGSFPNLIFSKEWTHLEEEDHGPGADAAHALAEVVTTIGHVSRSSPPPSPPPSPQPSPPSPLSSSPPPSSEACSFTH